MRTINEFINKIGYRRETLKQDLTNAVYNELSEIYDSGDTEYLNGVLNYLKTTHYNEKGVILGIENFNNYVEAVEQRAALDARRAADYQRRAIEEAEAIRAEIDARRAADEQRRAIEEAEAQRAEETEKQAQGEDMTEEEYIKFQEKVATGVNTGTQLINAELEYTVIPGSETEETVAVEDQYGQMHIIKKPESGSGWAWLLGLGAAALFFL